jgi:hypothetical protein
MTSIVTRADKGSALTHTELDTNFLAVFKENPTNVAANYTIRSGHNAMSAGPITINSGVTVTVPSGSTWSIV